MLWISLHLPLPLSAYPNLLAQLQRYTPRLAMLDKENIVALEIRASLRLFGGARAIWRALISLCPAGTLAGMAPTAFGAALLATHSRTFHRALSARTLARYLDALPCAALDLPAASHRDLDAWGCLTLGALRRLPRAGLMQRGLAIALQTLDRAYGFASHAPAWFIAPPNFQATRELAFRSTRVAALETALNPLLERFCDALRVHHAGAQQLHIRLHHDTRRSPQPHTLINLVLQQPESRPQSWRALIRLQLQAHPLPSPVIAVSLDCPQFCTGPAPSTQLFPDPAALKGHEAHLLDTLRARLGPNSIGYAAPQPRHLPEQAEAWSGQPSALQTHRRTPRIQPHWPQSRPFWILDPPILLATDQNSPLWQSRRLRLCGPPERLEGDWWQARPFSREYFIARDAQAARYWIYRDRLAGGWFLHGLFA